MSKPRTKGECQWLTMLRELRVSYHKRGTKSWVKKGLSRARRRSDAKVSACVERQPGTPAINLE